MSSVINVGIISDLDDQRASQLMTDAALKHAAGHLSMEIRSSWLTTTTLAKNDANIYLHDFNAVWAGPGDYAHSDAAIGAIQFCREQRKPFFGT